MKSILVFLIISLSLSFVFARNHTIERRIQYALIENEEFMNQLFDMMQSDSVSSILRSNFIKDFNLKKCFNEEPVTITYYKRQLLPDGYQIIFDSLLNGGVRKAITDTNTYHVYVEFPAAGYSDIIHAKYLTKFRGKTIYVDENFVVNGIPLLKPLNKYRVEEYDIGRSLSSIYSTLTIPFILYNGKLYIEPDSMQYYLVHE